MAKMRPNVAFKAFSGHIDGLIYIDRQGKNVVRPYKTPHNPRTKAQQSRRGLFADAVRSWQVLSDDEKYEWNRLARKNRTRRYTTGYNLYLGNVLCGRVQPGVTGTASFLVKDRAQTPFRMLRSSSVGTPLILSHCVETPSNVVPETFHHPG